MTITDILGGGLVLLAHLLAVAGGLLLGTSLSSGCGGRSVVDHDGCTVDADCRGLHEECLRLACDDASCVQVPDTSRTVCHTGQGIGGADGLCDHKDGTCRQWCASNVECPSKACVDSMCADACQGCVDEEGCHPGTQDMRCGRDGGWCSQCPVGQACANGACE